MADDTNVPAQTEGAGQTAKPRPEPVNLAMIEAAERGIDLTVPAPAEPKPKKAPPQAIQPELIEVRSPDEIEPIEPDEPAASAPAPVAEEGQDAPSAPAGEATEEAPGVSEDGTDGEKLSALAEAATKGRLSPGDEDRATKLMREFIKAGQPAPALEAMAKVPWILGVRAAEQAWPSLDEAARATLMDGIVGLGGDNAARLRLSLSRSLAKSSLPSGLRLASLTCSNLWNAEKGALNPEHSKLIGNVFIGRGKPWVLQLPLTGLPAEEALPIASCAVFSAFNVNNPPITQLSVLRYAASLLGSLHENLLGLVARGISRWSGKWQNALRKEVPELPPTLAAALKPDRGEAGPSESEEAPAEEVELPLPAELEEKLKAATENGDSEQLAAVQQEIITWREANRPAPVEKRDGGEEGGSNNDDSKRGRRQKGRDRNEGRNEGRGEARNEQRNEPREARNDRPEKKERPAYVPRDQARDARESRDNRDNRENEPAPRGPASFNLSSTLKQIESHVQQLRNELASTQSKLRKAETSRRTDRVSLSVEEASLSPDELRRLILQLESRNAELQARVEDSLVDSEVRAESMRVHLDGPAPDAATQLRTLLALKLQDGYADFIALEKGAPDVIVRQHYRGLLREIFSVLVEQSVPLVGDLPPPPPAPLPPPPPPPVDDSEEDEDDEEEIIDTTPEHPLEDEDDDDDDERDPFAPPTDEDEDEREEGSPDDAPAEDEDAPAESGEEAEEPSNGADANSEEPSQESAEEPVTDAQPEETPEPASVEPEPVEPPAEKEKPEKASRKKAE